MTSFIPYTSNHLKAGLILIQQSVYAPVAALDIAAWRTREPVQFELRKSGTEIHPRVGERWGDLFDCAWFNFTGQVPAEAAGQAVVLLLDVNGEMCIFDTAGVPVRGLTSKSSEFDKSLGLPGKRILPFLEQARGGEPVDVWADAGCNDLFGYVQDNGVIREAHIAVFYPALRDLYYDFEVLLDSLNVLPETSARYEQIRVALFDVIHLLWNGITPELVQQARARLAPVLECKGGNTSLTVSAIGHAHIDLGWLWPVRETHRKGARTFATALANMEHYPDYIFAASQAQLFQWLKDDHPILYDRIRQKVKEGRIEPQGALWVECDTNLTSGESLVRQILYGKRFFSSEFGIDPGYVWLPDTFGYSGALPQIIRRAGMKYFSTQKLSWSLINKFPYHSFHWQGIDGTSVLVHMLPEETYNSSALPRAVAKIEANYFQKGISSQALLVFGIGDGGGGPGEEHLERLQRLQNFSGLCPVRQRWTSDFFSEWEKDSGRFPTWVGELYLERHQGTLTTNARNKWYNRRMEQVLRELEWTAVLAEQWVSAQYPQERLEAIWKEVLLYQFHDILPGSSIKRVYDESQSRYALLYAEVSRLLEIAQLKLAKKMGTAGLQQPFVVFNSLGWQRDEWLKLGETWHKVQVPPMGFNVVDAAAQVEPYPPPFAASDRLENDCLKVQFGSDGAIISLYDKVNNREVIPSGESANRLAVYKDHGDAWDIPMDYQDSQPVYLSLANWRAWVDGPRAVLEQVYRLGHSELVQEISLVAGSRQLTFKNSLHWRETASMLRVLFPADLFAEEAAFDIQFGHVRRPTHTNTTWDLAKDEVPAQKWADLSQRDYGLAVLNDSKYGHRVKGNTIELNLLRSVLYPGQRVVWDEDIQPGEAHHAYTDQSDHVFIYALYPHPDDLGTGGVIQAAYELNYPLRVVQVNSHPGELPSQWSFLEVDVPNIVIETVKRSENGSGMVIRLYETWRASTHATLTCSLPVQSAQECNLLEIPEKSILAPENRLQLSFKPFEIKTLFIRFHSR